jgi:hypothetical protein
VLILLLIPTILHQQSNVRFLQPSSRTPLPTCSINHRKHYQTTLGHLHLQSASLLALPAAQTTHQHVYHTNSSSPGLSPRLPRRPLQSQTVCPRLQTKNSQSDQEFLLVNREHQRFNGFPRQPTNSQPHSPSHSSTRGRTRRKLIRRRLQISLVSLTHSFTQTPSSPSQLQPAPSFRPSAPTHQLITTNKWRFNWKDLTHRRQLLPQETLQPHHQAFAATTDTGDSATGAVTGTQLPPLLLLCREELQRLDHGWCSQ